MSWLKGKDDEIIKDDSAFLAQIACLLRRRRWGEPELKLTNAAATKQFLSCSSLLDLGGGPGFRGNVSRSRTALPLDGIGNVWHSRLLPQSRE